MKENGKAGLARKVGDWLKRLEAAGAPIWFRKIHGSRFQRDMPDFLWMIAHKEKWTQIALCRAGAIELKNPENPKPPTPKQLQELKRIAKGGGGTLVSHDLEEVQRYIAIMLLSEGWQHATLTEPYL